MGIRLVVFLFLDENICCEYSLEVPWRGASNEYPQCMFSSRNKKNIDTFWLKKAPYQELCIQSDLVLQCLLTESLDTTELMNGEQRL